MLAIGVLVCVFAKGDEVVAKARFVWSTGDMDFRWLVQWYTVLAILCLRKCMEQECVWASRALQREVHEILAEDD